jgi:penicillin amidase
MSVIDAEVLHRLGKGESIESVRAFAGISADEFEEWWNGQLSSRVPDMAGTRRVEGAASVEIFRDQWGIPHVFADSDDDLFFGYGFAMGQDRLWQLDYLRRKAHGRLSEILGPDGLELDIVARTVGINRIAAEEFQRLPDGTSRRLQAFSRGINAAMDEASDHLPIEFDLLDYRPEPWAPVDSIAIWAEFRWYLTGRLPVIIYPEMALRALGDGPLYKAFLTGEAEDESILPPGSYEPRRNGADPVGVVVSDPDEGLGSNNWVIDGKLSASGKPIVASDPHIAFASVSCWYEAHLSGGDVNAVGSGYAGVPGLMFGRNERVAWGLTNNICAQRDLYQEREDPAHPGCFQYNGKWDKWTEIEEQIEVHGADSVVKTVRVSRNGPIVDELLPDQANDTGPVAFRWMGHEPCDEITGMLDMAVSSSVDEFREAMQDWVVPTLSIGFADVDGHIGYQSVGRLPIKENWGRGYRPGWDPAHQWRESIPYDAMPSVSDPVEGWVRSANNRTAPEDFPYPLSGVWSSGYRAKRVRNMIEAGTAHTREDLSRMQLDTLSLRAVDSVPGLLGLLHDSDDPRIVEALVILASWDRRMEPDSIGASIFELFFDAWVREVAGARFEGDAVGLLASATSGLSTELLSIDQHGWFANEDRVVAAGRAMTKTLDALTKRLGPDMLNWQWGNMHKVALNHTLSGRGEIFATLDRGGDPVGGSGITVCNTGFDPNYLAGMGANYRLNADLADPKGLWAVDAAGQSGHPGSPNYCDQLSSWLVADLHYLPLDRAGVVAGARDSLRLFS